MKNKKPKTDEKTSVSKTKIIFPFMFWSLFVSLMNVFNSLEWEV